MNYLEPISTAQGGPYVLVPFATKDGGKLGGNAHALHRALVVPTLPKHTTPLLCGIRLALSPDVARQVGQEMAAKALHMTTPSDVQPSHH
jgi:hypothetical protein